VDFLRDSVCAVITLNSECSADFGEARGMTDRILNGFGEVLMGSVAEC
jgi:hypothetical protein